jgi:murein L,D-transpeptidase YcbB/YkuD
VSPTDRRLGVGGLALLIVLAPGCRKASEARGAAPPAAAPELAANPPADEAPASPAAVTADAARATVRGVLDAVHHPWLRWPDVAGVLPDLEALYAAEPDGLFWFDGTAPHPAVDGALKSIASAADLALDPADYDAEALAARAAALKGGGTPEDRALFDAALSAASMRLLQTVRWGRVDPADDDFEYDVRGKRLDLAATLRGARDSGGLAAAIAAAEPRFPTYRRLLDALRRYRELAAAEPPAVPGLPGGAKKLAPGKTWTGVPALAARLRALGDLPPGADRPAAAAGGAPAYGGALVEAVKAFQDRHALEPDGVLTAETIEHVNVPFARRARQIELAVERVRWIPVEGDRRFVLVNVPLFRLWTYDPARPDDVFRMNVVTGSAHGHATPLFVGEMAYVVFRPYWNPPMGILRKEILPRARKDPGYLARQNMEIVASGADDAPALPATPENLDKVAAGRLTLRQKPGEKNSLGLAKFIFPNAHNVYLHGTPAQSLFARARRDFSHGCIRLEDPPRFAEWVLRDDPAWTRERIDGAMKGERPTRATLKEKLLVVLFYDTVLVDAKGLVHFSDDYYGHDAKLEEALAHGYPYPRSS